MKDEGGKDEISSRSNSRLGLDRLSAFPIHIFQRWGNAFVSNRKKNLTLSKSFIIINIIRHDQLEKEFSCKSK